MTRGMQNRWNGAAFDHDTMVKVPVLSEQITVALPIVSQADKTLTKLPSLSIFCMEYAKEIVMASGNPAHDRPTRTIRHHCHPF
jgi:hypothetical protein